MELTAASMEGSNSVATSFLDLAAIKIYTCEKVAAYPVNFSWPFRIPTLESLSNGEPKGMN